MSVPLVSKPDSGCHVYDKQGDKERGDTPTIVTVREVDESTISTRSNRQNRWTRRLLKAGVEGRGIVPVPPEEQTDTQFYKLFFLFFTWNINILTFSAGTLGPVIFGLGLGDSCLAIIFFNALFCIPGSYEVTWGPKLGMRTMVLARYSFGYYGTMPLAFLNLVTMIGFSIMAAIVGGQALASITDGLSWAIGIVVVCIVSLLVSFCGVKVLNWLSLIGWIPFLTTFIIAAGFGGKHFPNPPPATTPLTASAIIGYASSLAGFTITYCPLATDASVYYRPNVSAWRVFLYVYSGLVLSLIPIQCLGAATAIAATTIPEWQQRYGGADVGALLGAVLQPLGGFGKFLSVLLALSITPNIAATSYSITVIWQACIPRFAAIPRYVYAVVSTAIMIAIAIPGASKFYDTLTNLLGLTGYWAAAFIAVIFLEHIYFRRQDSRNYEVAAWNDPRKLPLGIAAAAASIGSFAVVVPCMDQTWFTGPIAKITGDIGFEVAMAATGLLYVPLRLIEKRVTGR